MAAVRDLIMPLLRGRHPEQRRAAQGPLVNLGEPRGRKELEQSRHAAEELACRNLALAIYG